MTEQQIEQIVRDKLHAEVAKIKRKWLLVGALVALIIPLTIWAATINKPHTFNDGDTLSAAKLNENFDALYAKVNEMDAFVSTVKGSSNGIIDADKLRIKCPTGFTSIEAQGRQMGCLQNDIRGTNTCMNAVLDCFDVYGGRLPTFNEIYAGFNRFALLNEGTGYQWLDVGFYGSLGSTCAAMNPSVPDAIGATTLQSYRCFIPR